MTAKETAVTRVAVPIPKIAIITGTFAALGILRMKFAIGLKISRPVSFSPMTAPRKTPKTDPIKYPLKSTDRRNPMRRNHVTYIVKYLARWRKERIVRIA